MTSDELKWSSQLHVASPARGRLQGDKITLPQSALESLLAAAPIVPIENHRGQPLTSTFDPFNPYSYESERNARNILSDRQQQLPHPLTFQLLDPETGQQVFAGVKEFSAEEGKIGLSTFLQKALGLGSQDPALTTPIKPAENGTVLGKGTVDAKTFQLRVIAKQLPKGNYVRLRPLEAGYDAEDWKSLLERHLRDNFTTLTKGVVLDISGAKQERYKFLVDKFEPEGDGICVVDTDLEVDIEALDEEQARETLKQRQDKTQRAPGTVLGSSAGGNLVLGQETSGQVLPGEFVDYELKSWDRNADLYIALDGIEGADVDLVINPIHSRQQAKPRLDEHIFADLSCRPAKRLKLARANVDLELAESLAISIHGPRSESSQPMLYVLGLSEADVSTTKHEEATDLGISVDEVKCKNCKQVVPKQSLPLHEAFCYRNNTTCPKCFSVFLKNSDEWRQHWHCPHDDEYGGGEPSRTKHNLYFHPPRPIPCPACDFEAFNLPILAEHRTTSCPGKEILCQFCHLLVPQQGPDDPSLTDAEVILSGLTPHELSDGARTTECHLCMKIVRLRDMRTHLRLHDGERISRPRPILCINEICGRTLRDSKIEQILKEQVGLCDDCFSPLYGADFDPEHRALRRRIERRLLQQLMAGCGKAWCHNSQWCRTGRKNSTGKDVVVSAKDALPVIKPILDRLARGDASGLRFCVDEASQSRKAMGQILAAEGVYDVEFCIASLQETKNDLHKAREWLIDRAPTKEETQSARP